MAPGKSKVESTVVLDTLYEIEILASHVKKLNLAWAKAHVNVEGNKQADQLAKAGAEMIECEQRSLPLPKKHNRDMIKQAIRIKWEQEWTSAVE